MRPASKPFSLLLILLALTAVNPPGRADDTAFCGVYPAFVPNQWFVIGIGEAPGETFVLGHRMGQTLFPPDPWSHLTNVSFWLRQPPGVFQPTTMDLVIYEFASNHTVGPELFRSRTPTTTTGLQDGTFGRFNFEVGLTLFPDHRYLLLLDPMPYRDGTRRWVQVCAGAGIAGGAGGATGEFSLPAPVQPINETVWGESTLGDTAFHADFIRPPRPILRMYPLLGRELGLYWPTNPPGFMLETAVEPGSAHWTPATNEVIVVGVSYAIRFFPDAPSQFFRLRSGN